MFSGGTWTAGPNLPLGLAATSVTILNPGVALLVGGRSDAGTERQTYIYNWDGTVENLG